MKYISIILSVIAVGLCLFVLNQTGYLGDRTMSPNWSPSAVQAYATSGNLAASTTLFSVSNPLSATSTLDFLAVNMTGVATSTFTLTCGTSTSAYGETAPPSNTLVDNIDVVTSTLRYVSNGQYGFYAGTNSKDRILVGPNDRIMCKVTTTGEAFDNAFTNASSTFDGTYKFRLIK